MNFDSTKEKIYEYSKKNINALTGLRFVDELSIVLVHYGVFVLDSPYKVAIFAEQARAGVRFFLSSAALFYFTTITIGFKQA